MCINYDGLNEVVEFIKNHRRLYKRVVEWLSWDKDKQEILCPFVRKKSPANRIDIGRKYDRYYCENTCAKIFDVPRYYENQVFCPCYRDDVHESTVELVKEKVKELLL
jgi:hypothetical protein